MAHEFVLVGGHPALDFLNTIHDWTAPEQRDYLPDAAAARRFALAAGLLGGTEASALAAGPRGELARLVALRGRLERIFRSVVAGRGPAAADLDALAGEAGRAAGAARLRTGKTGISRHLDPRLAGPALLRWRIAEAAVALLVSPRLERVNACPTCGWFFLDLSKNRSRRWCSMTACGSSAKARRYYRRNRRKARAP